MKKLFLLLAFMTLSLTQGMAENVIKLTTALKAGSKICFSVNGENVTVEGADEGSPNEYTVKNQTITIKGKVFVLNCYGAELTALDLSHCTTLTTLRCQDNKLTSLDLSKNTKIQTIDCSKNKLNSLSNLSTNTELSTLYCWGNELTTLDLSKNNKLADLHCSSNKLKDLKLPATVAKMNNLDFGNNNLLGTVIDNIINSLPVLDAYRDFTCYYVGATENNVITKKQVEAAKKKNWIAQSFDPKTIERKDYEGTIDASINGVSSGINDENAPTYNLSGQKVGKDYKGVVIKNGKKFIQR